MVLFTCPIAVASAAYAVAWRPRAQWFEDCGRFGSVRTAAADQSEVPGAAIGHPLGGGSAETEVPRHAEAADQLVSTG